MSIPDAGAEARAQAAARRAAMKLLIEIAARDDGYDIAGADQRWRGTRDGTRSDGLVVETEYPDQPGRHRETGRGNSNVSFIFFSVYQTRW